ncbi:Cytochrome P450 [Mycena kentingensis (nom. inval.)]|nr:Cytochrome P450 [Mycena kentingensis (nom. inval.)]
MPPKAFSPTLTGDGRHPHRNTVYRAPDDGNLRKFATLNSHHNSMDPTADPITPSRSAPTIAHATPHHPSSDGTTHRTVAAIQNILVSELQDAWIEEADTLPFQQHLAKLITDHYTHAYQRDLDTEIAAWLATCRTYSGTNQRWKDIGTGGLENTLYDPLVNIMNAILNKFAPSSKARHGKQRKFINTHDVVFSHNSKDLAEDATQDLRSCPDILAVGVGPSATCESKLPSFDQTTASYEYAASIWEAKRKNTFEESQQKQIAVYARETFIWQPNRKFVYVSLISFSGLRVLRFDRSGCYYTRCFDYHADPALFVKLVLLLTTYDEELLGLDTSIYWEKGQRKMRMTPPEIFDSVAGAMVPNTTELVLILLENYPVFARRTIRSRGTVCWVAVYQGRHYIIKDYWRATPRVAEYEFLRELVGVPGVGQMLTYLPDRETICQGRAVTEMRLANGQDVISDRTLVRVVVRQYGATLEHAKSPRHFLSAILAITEGHRDSVNRENGILQGDISIDNIRLSPDEDREVAVIIDWDLAKRIKNQILTKGDLRTGTRAFQSSRVLARDPRLGAPDQMDDLESIFYVMFFILCGYDEAGQQLVVNVPPQITDWLDITEEDGKLSELKGYFLTRKYYKWPAITRYPVAQRVLETMLGELRSLFAIRAEEMQYAVATQDATEFVYSEEKMRADYQTFLGIIRKALPALPEDPADAEETASAAPTAVPSRASSCTPSKKRALDNPDGGETPPLKRRDSPAASHRVGRGALLLRPGQEDVSDDEAELGRDVRSPSPCTAAAARVANRGLSSGSA